MCVGSISVHYIKSNINLQLSVTQVLVTSSRLAEASSADLQIRLQILSSSLMSQIWNTKQNRDVDMIFYINIKQNNLSYCFFLSFYSYIQCCASFRKQVRAWQSSCYSSYKLPLLLFFSLVKIRQKKNTCSLSDYWETIKGVKFWRLSHGEKLIYKALKLETPSINVT